MVPLHVMKMEFPLVTRDGLEPGIRPDELVAGGVVIIPYCEGI
jgi:hypothetical protein